MKKLGRIGVALILACASRAIAAGIPDTSWNKSATASGIGSIQWNRENLQKLNSFNKASVASFLTQVSGNFSGHGDCECVKPKDIGDFTWTDLAGDGKDELVATLDVNGRAFFNALVIFARDPAGKVTYQEIRGEMITDLRKVIRDLKGDGQSELIVPTHLISYSGAETFTWPAVYRLRDGQYTESSRDFPRFYDEEVLPELEKQITRLQERSDQQNQNGAALLTLERDKILRIIGRDPKAGLEQAYEWMKSDDPKLLQNAAVTFQDIGGHEEELRAADAALKRALAQQASTNGGT